MIKELKERHGGPYDRGSADRYYSRPFSPHYFKGDTYMSDRVEKKDMTADQIKQYKEGYEISNLELLAWSI